MIWGVPEKLTAAEMEISNLPPDALKVRIRLRPKMEGRAFVKFANRVESWILGFDNGKMFLMMLRGVNSASPLKPLTNFLPAIPP